MLRRAHAVRLAAVLLVTATALTFCAGCDDDDFEYFYEEVGYWFHDDGCHGDRCCDDWDCGGSDWGFDFWWW